VRILPYALCALWGASNLFAAGVVKPLLDYLRETPATVSGTLAFDETFPLMRSVGVNVSVLASKKDLRKQVGFSFSEGHIELLTSNALYVTSLGIPTGVNVRSIRYDRNGKFTVKLDTPFNVLEKELEEGVRKKLETLFKAKLETAFAELDKIRRSQDLNDIRNVSKTVMEVFRGSGPSSVRMPGISGDVRLTFQPPARRNLTLGSFTAEIEKGTRVSAGFDFSWRGSRFEIDGAEVTSVPGLIVRRATDDNPMKAVRFHRIAIDGDRFDMNYGFSAMEVLMMLNTVVDPNHDCRLACNLDVAGLRARLDPVLGLEISTLVKRFERELKIMGVPPRLFSVIYKAYPPR
jgi:hypothetical protein